MSAPRPDLADVLSGDLDEAGRAAAQERMASDPEFRAEVERLMPISDALGALPADAWDTPEPPALKTPEEHEAIPLRRRLPAATRPLIAAAAAIAIALLAFGLGRVTSDSASDPGGRVVSLPALEGASGSGIAEIADDGSAMTVELTDLAPSAPGEYYELWLLNSPDDLISVGAIRVPESGSVSVSVPVPLRPERYQFLDLSVEPADGDPAHSGKSVLRGETA